MALFADFFYLVQQLQAEENTKTHDENTTHVLLL
jgi:hypothetical protein